MRIVIEVSEKEAEQICNNKEGVDIILNFLKEEVNRIETFEGNEYKSNIIIKTNPYAKD
jgi:hypothetical protein